MSRREEFATKIDVADWSCLRAHLHRDGLIIVGGSLDLADVAVKIANDDAGTIGGWIALGELGKPSVEQITAWDANKTHLFNILIVSPYVLIQQCDPSH